MRNSASLLFPQTCADATLAEVEAALRQKEDELAKLRAEYETLRAELTAVKQGLSTTTERPETPHQEGQVRTDELCFYSADGF